MFKNPFSFNGRIRRLEYIVSYLFYFACYLGFEILIEHNEMFGLLGLLFLPLFWILLAQGAKRCHDRGTSGWFQIIPFYIVVLILAEGLEGPNKYGPNPKGIGNNPEIAKSEFE